VRCIKTTAAVLKEMAACTANKLQPLHAEPYKTGWKQLFYLLSVDLLKAEYALTTLPSGILIHAPLLPDSI